MELLKKEFPELTQDLENKGLMAAVEGAIYYIEAEYPLRDVRILGEYLSSLDRTDMDAETAAKIVYLGGIFTAKDERLKKEAVAALDQHTKSEKKFSLAGIDFNRIAIMERAYAGSPEVDSLEQDVILLKDKLKAAQDALTEAKERTGFTHEQEKSFYYRYK